MMTKIRLIIFGVLIVILIALGITIGILSKRISNLTDDLSYASANEKALLLKNDSDKNKIRSLQLTVEQLDYFNDSILQKLNQAKQDLKIKDKNIKELQYLNTIAKKTDTLRLTDTIFVEDFCMDTIIQDQWHKTTLELCYPNEIIVTPEFESEKIIITHTSRETIKPPHKCKFFRLFQRKHTVIMVDIKEENPYITTKEYRHIEIIK